MVLKTKISKAKYYILFKYFVLEKWYYFSTVNVFIFIFL